MMDVSYGLDRSTNLWVHGRDILRDIFGYNSLHKVYTSACHPSCRFVKRGCLYDRIDVIYTGGNNGFGADLEFTREIEFEKDFVLEDLKSFVGSVVEEDSSGVKNSLSKRQQEFHERVGESYEFRLGAV
ncbi:hypothetical protein Tco_0049789 [Tanacetum coccineum]